MVPQTFSSVDQSPVNHPKDITAAMMWMPVFGLGGTHCSKRCHVYAGDPMSSYIKFNISVAAENAGYMTGEVTTD
jgi:hypothetical protein